MVRGVAAGKNQFKYEFVAGNLERGLDAGGYFLF